VQLIGRWGVQEVREREVDEKVRDEEVREFKR
jgi:hypothetical protein